MKSPWLKKLLRITGIIFLLVLVTLTIVVYRFTTPRKDLEIVEMFKEEETEPYISHLDFQGHRVRIIQMQAVINKNLPTLIFIHGSPGSAMDFKRYLKDEKLNRKANLISYDRVGYGNLNTGIILPSVREEVELLHEIVEESGAENTVLVGYSYGGTVVMASPLSFKKKIALAAAVRGDLEPLFWALNLYKWPFTRSMVPKIVRAAAEEKIRHVKELAEYDDKWGRSSAQVVSIHGKKDFIVPYQNSLYLAQKLGEKFKLVTLEDGDHSLIWTDFELIRDHLLESLNE